MNIIATQYSLSTKSLDIYLAGCKGPHCAGCHNHLTWDFNQGTPWGEWEDKLTTKLFHSMVEKVYVMGGEPLDQDLVELENLLRFLKGFGKEIRLFTGRETKWDIPFDIRMYCDYIKVGQYLEDYKVEGYYSYGDSLASSNQKVLKRGVDY